MKSHLFIPLLLALVACGKPAEKEKETFSGPIPVTTAAVTPAGVAATIEVSGMVASEQEARLSFKTGGVIQRILVKEGDRVRKGQLLATLNLTEINAQVAQARVGLEKATRDYQRVENLYKDSVATLEQLQNARSGLDVAKESLTIATYNQGFSEIRAPKDGVVLRKLMNEGEVTGPGTPVLFVSGNGPSDWVLRAGLTDRDWVRVKEGITAMVTLDAFPGVSFSATLSNLSQAADPMSGLYQAEFRLQAQGKNLAPGLFGKASVPVSGGANLPSIPADALMEGNGNQAYVFVAEGNTAVRKPVTVAFIQNDRAMVSGGLEGIKEVITVGSAYLLDGSAIEVSAIPQTAQK